MCFKAGIINFLVSSNRSDDFMTLKQRETIMQPVHRFWYPMEWIPRLEAGHNYKSGSLFPCYAVLENVSNLLRETCSSGCVTNVGSFVSLVPGESAYVCCLLRSWCP